MSQPIGVAVIGCGSTAEKRHLPVWSRLAGARLTVTVSRDPQRAQRAAERYGAERAETDWRQLLHDPAVQIADICVPHPLHAQVAVALLRAGKHVLCEKPLASDLAGAQAMVQAAAAAGTVLLPFHNMRLLGASAAAVNLVRSGRIGRTLLLRGVMAHGGPDATDPRRQWFLQASAGGGVVLDLGPHLFDLVRAMVPAPAARLRAWLLSAPGAEVERDGVIEVLFADGATAVLTLSWSLAVGRETTLVVQGEQGVVRLCLGLTPELSPGATPAPLMLGEGWWPQATVSYPPPEPDREPCAVMLAAVRGEPVALDARDGLEVMRWIDAAYRSQAAGGAWISL